VRPGPVRAVQQIQPLSSLLVDSLCSLSRGDQSRYWVHWVISQVCCVGMYLVEKMQSVVAGGVAANACRSYPSR